MSKTKKILLISLALNGLLLMSFFIIIPGLKKENDLFFRRMIEAELKGKKYYFGKEEEDLTPVEKNLRQKWDIEIESFKKT